MPSPVQRLLGLPVLLTAVLLSGCRPPAAASGPPPGPPEVAVVTIAPRRLVLTTVLPGRTSGFKVAEIRPQVSGRILRRLFEEGSDVKAGQDLYEIDPAPFQAAVDIAEANLLAAKKAADRARAAVEVSTAAIARAEATLDLARTDRRRLEELFENRAVSASERDRAVTDVAVAEASLRAAKAQVESDRAAVATADAAIGQAEAARNRARIDLGYTSITAPISGRIGPSAVTEGATVTAYQPQALATIHRMDPIYVDVTQSTSDLARLRRELADGRLTREDSDRDHVRLELEDGTRYSRDGTLEFQDVTVDPSTGSVVLRMVFPNPDGTLLPGMFVRAIVVEGVDEKAILVPQPGVARDPKGQPIALVVGADGKVAQRALTLDRAIGAEWRVTEGLAPGDRVIVEGRQKVRAGMSVKVVDAPREEKPTPGRD